MLTLIDTNILVYATGADGDRTRQQMAIQALRDHRAHGTLSVQVLAEFASVLIRKGTPLETVRSDICTLEKTWQIVTPDAGTVSLALAGVDDYSMSFWDAMLWATAKHHGLTTILSEDGPTGSTVGEVLYLSPF